MLWLFQLLCIKVIKILIKKRQSDSSNLSLVKGHEMCDQVKKTLARLWTQNTFDQNVIGRNRRFDSDVDVSVFRFSWLWPWFDNCQNAFTDSQTHFKNLNSFEGAETIARQRMFFFAKEKLKLLTLLIKNVNFRLG